MDPLRVGIVGIGNISSIYLKNLGAFSGVEVVALADLDISRAEAAAAANGIANALSPDALIEHPDVELVLNLTIPAAHGTVALQAVKAGKHVYNEKPLAVKREEAKEFLNIAAGNGVLVGCAPDTFMGSSGQEARKLIDEGLIGEIVGASAYMLSGGVEMWHPNPEFFYKAGGGPMFDMGPYYLTALANLLGSVKRVTGMTRISFPERMITSEPLKGQSIQVEVPTHVVGLLEYENGAIAEISTSFDVKTHEMHPITIYGSKGTMKVPDPNGFSNEWDKKSLVRVRLAGESEWTEYEGKHCVKVNGRGIGVLDLGYAARNGGKHRASGDLAYHVLDIMHSIHDSSTEGKHIELRSHIERPEAMAEDLYAEEMKPLLA